MDTEYDKLVRMFLKDVVKLQKCSGATMAECLEHFENEFWGITVDLLALNILEGA